MDKLAVLLGRFVGAVLDECGPTIVRILRNALRDTAEDGQLDRDLRNDLLDRVRQHEDGVSDDRKV